MKDMMIRQRATTLVAAVLITLGCQSPIPDITPTAASPTPSSVPASLLPYAKAEPGPEVSAPTGGYEFKSQIDLPIDLDAVAPSDVKHELSTFTVPHYVWEPKVHCLGDENYHPSTFYLEPTIIEATTSLNRRTLLPGLQSLLIGSDMPDICACGFERNEMLNISLIGPFGETVLEVEATAEPEFDAHGDITLISTYCYKGHEISDFDFLPGDPLGEYTVEVKSEDARLIHSFVLEELDAPAVYYSSRLKGFVIAGFEPFEEVRVLVYSGLAFAGEGRVVLDENGIGLLTNYDPLVTVFIVGEDLEFVVARSAIVRPPVGPPLDYSRILELDPTNARAYYYRSLSSDSFSDRMADLTRATELAPDYVAAYEMRAGLYELQGNYDQAIADYTKVVELAPDSVAAYYARAHLYEEQGNYDQAIADYSKVVELAPTHMPAYYARARLYYSQGDYNKALADFINAIELDRIDYYDNRPYASYYGSADDFTKAIELAPDNVLAYYRRGELYSRLGDDAQTITTFIKTVADFSKAIELDPDYLPAYYKRARLYESWGNYDRAIADYTRIIELDPSYLPAYYLRAHLYESQKDSNRAIADYSKVIEIAPPYTCLPAYYARARLYYSLGKYNEALADSMQAIELDRELGYDNYGGSVDDYTIAISLAPYYALAYYMRGVAHGWMNPEQAIADLTRAIELYPDYLPAYEERARRYQGENSYDRAIADYSRIIELGPDHLSAYQERANLYEKRGNYDQAIADLERALELTTDEYWRKQAEERLQKLKGEYDQ